MEIRKVSTLSFIYGTKKQAQQRAHIPSSFLRLQSSSVLYSLPDLVVIVIPDNSIHIQYKYSKCQCCCDNTHVVSSFPALLHLDGIHYNMQALFIQSAGYLIFFP